MSPDFDFGADPHCRQGLLHAVVTASGDLVLLCDEDGAVYAHPELIRSAPPEFPRSDDDYEIGGGLHLRPGTWRSARLDEVEGAGWEPFLRVEVLVAVSGPPWIVPDGEDVSMGASTTRGEVRTGALVAHLVLPRDLGGRSIGRLLLTPADPPGAFDRLELPVDVVGRAIPIDGSEAVEFTGTVRWWGPPSPGPAAIGCL
jgi:hypothetical protein